MRPMGWANLVGCSISSTVTTWPSTGALPPGATRMSCAMRRSSGTAGLPAPRSARHARSTPARPRVDWPVPGFRRCAPPDARGDRRRRCVRSRDPRAGPRACPWARDVGLLVVANHETEPVGMTRDPPRKQIGLVRQNERLAAVAQHLPIALHRTQAPFEQTRFIRPDIEQRTQGVELDTRRRTAAAPPARPALA